MDFYGYAGEIITEDEGEYRQGIEFSLVPREILDGMLQVQGGRDMPPESKLRTLGNEPVYYFHGYMSEVVLSEIESGGWYGIGLFDENVPNSFEGILFDQIEKEEWPPQTEKKFAKLYGLSDFEVENLTNLYIASTVNDSFGETPYCADANEPIGMVTIYDVGQALCVGIKQQNEHGTADPIVFFDFGIPHTAGHAKPQEAVELGTIVSYVDTLASLGCQIKIILSHWHLDHVLIFNYIAQASFQKIRVYAPDRLEPSTVPIYNYVKSLVPAHEFLITNRAFAGVTLYTNENIILNKTDGYHGAGRVRPHIHHYCYGMEVSLISGTNILLTGDGTYGLYLPLTKEKQYTVLQASHHGGNFAVNFTAAAVDIPQPKDEAIVVYSYGPNTYGHPDQRYVDMHTQRGWITMFDTSGNVDIT